MAYELGRHSRRELIGVNPSLVAVVERAMEITEQDFTVHDGLRTMDEQREYVRRGVSKTLKSRHLKQVSTGWGHAADLVPYINGKLRWEMEACYVIAEAMKQAAEELNVKIRWGGGWRVLNNSTISVREMVDRYVERCRKAGKRALVDGPHFELMP